MNHNFCIGDIVISIDSDFFFKITESYSKFKIQSRERTPDINIKLLSKNDLKYDLDRLTAIVKKQKSVYVWIEDTFNRVLCFGRRGLPLCENDEKDIWFLICDNQFSNCILSIDPMVISCTDYFSAELFSRPWIPRLFSSYISKTNRFILHGACVQISRDKGILFLGNSGAGKSTACTILQNDGYNVLSDDRVLIKFSEVEQKLFCYGTPWNIKNPHFSRNDMIEVMAFFFLSHGTNKIERIKTFNDFYKRFSCQILHSAYKIDSLMAIWEIQSIKSIYQTQKIFEISFEPNSSFSTFIEHVVEKEKL